MYNDFYEVCWPWGFPQSSNVSKTKGNVRKKREFYLDYRELYKNFIKQNFCTLEQFLELTLFEVTVKIDDGQGSVIVGKAIDEDIMEASINAYINAINKKLDIGI